MGDSSQAGKEEEKAPVILEWTIGILGLVFALGLIGFIGWEALNTPKDAPPELEVRVERVLPAGEGYVAEIIARNRARQTAASVTVEGTVVSAGGSPETSTTTIDYVPGKSKARGGLYFQDDPRGRLELRVTGYTIP